MMGSSIRHQICPPDWSADRAEWSGLLRLLGIRGTHRLTILERA